MQSQQGQKIRWGLILGTAAAVLLGSWSWAAEKYPSKPVTLTVAFEPGGRTDIVARLLAPLFKEILGQPVVVLNKPGAGGFVGYKSVAAARPDGYTIGFVGGGLLPMQYTGAGKIRWEEFKWVGQLTTAAMTVSVPADSPWKTLEEFIKFAKENPMKIKCAHTTYGGVTHLNAEGFAQAAGIKLTQIAYKGDAPAAVAVASKEVDMTCVPLGGLRQYIEAGKVRVLAVMSDRRPPQFPDIPTLKERGINWAGGMYEALAAPKETPEAVISILDHALARAMKDPNFQESLKKFDLLVDHLNHKDFTVYIEQQDKKYHRLLKEVGLIKG